MSALFHLYLCREQRGRHGDFDEDTAEGGLDALTQLIRDCGLPTRVSELRSKVEITPALLREVADTCNIIKCNPRELSRDEIYDILCECM